MADDCNEIIAYDHTGNIHLVVVNTRENVQYTGRIRQSTFEAVELSSKFTAAKHSEQKWVLVLS